jgi:uncharacterized cupin superfamily protein
MTRDANATPLQTSRGMCPSRRPRSIALRRSAVCYSPRGARHRRGASVGSHLQSLPRREGHRARRERVTGSDQTRVGKKIGATQMGMSVYQLQAGQAVCGYQEWTDEEWLIVLAGTPTLRTPEGERTLEPADITCFRVGPTAPTAPATNRRARAGRDPLDHDPFWIAEYPDSDKVGVCVAGSTA